MTSINSVTELDVEGNFVRFDLEVPDLATGHEVLGRVRIDDGLQGGKQGGFGHDGHGGNSGLGAWVRIAPSRLNNPQPAPGTKNQARDPGEQAREV